MPTTTFTCIKCGWVKSSDEVGIADIDEGFTCKDCVNEANRDKTGDISFMKFLLIVLAVIYFLTIDWGKMLMCIAIISLLP